MSKKLLPVLCLALVPTVFLSACGGTVGNDIRKTTARRIAMPAFMVQRDIQAGDFTLYAWERMHQRGAPATLYIEGDGGPVDLSGLTFDKSLTPENPVALHLASRDNSDNLAYLARPCQYGNARDKVCKHNLAYARAKSFAPEVIDAYMQTLNEIRARYDLTGFHLVGYGGGANIAALLTARRHDVLSLRTVAGNLDLESFTLTHPDRDYTDSLNAKDCAAKTAHTPQHHFIGAGDEIVVPAVYHSFRQAAGESPCIRYSVISDADHISGWVEKWPELLKRTPECAAPLEEPAPLPVAAPKEPKKYKK